MYYLSLFFANVETSFSWKALRQDQENKDLLAAKGKLLKNTRPRAVLGDLVNETSLVPKVKQFTSILNSRRLSK